MVCRKDSHLNFRERWPSSTRKPCVLGANATSAADTLGVAMCKDPLLRLGRVEAMLQQLRSGNGGRDTCNLQVLEMNELLTGHILGGRTCHGGGRHSSAGK